MMISDPISVVEDCREDFDRFSLIRILRGRDLDFFPLSVIFFLGGGDFRLYGFKMVKFVLFFFTYLISFFSDVRSSRF